jgi:hypothetical protein
MLDVYCHRQNQRTEANWQCSSTPCCCMLRLHDSATSSTIALRAMYLENPTYSDQPVDDMPPVLQAFDLCSTNVPYWLSHSHPVVCTNLSMAWLYGGMNVTLRGLWTGDDSMARGIFSAASPTPRKGKGAMKSDQIQSLLEVLLLGSQPYLLSKRARRRRFCQNPHVPLQKSTLYERTHLAH